MAHKHISFIFAALMVWILSSCNDEVFIPRKDLPDVSEITLDGNGDSWSMVCSKKGLDHIYINGESSSVDNQYLTYYGSNGNIVNHECPASEISSIEYYTPLLSYSIGFYGNMINVICHYNITSETNITVMLDYDYGVSKMIHISLTEGKQYRLNSWVPTGKPILDENFEKVTHRASFTNNSNLTQNFELNPLFDSKCTDQVIPVDFWAIGLTVKLPMPTFTGKEWVWHEYKDISLGNERTFSPLTFYNDKLTIDVPANKKATVIYTLYYSRMTHHGVLHFYNPVDMHEFQEDITWTAVYATSYDYNVEYE